MQQSKNNPMYIRNLDKKIHQKIERISKETNVAKWLVVEKLLADSLGVKTKNKLDLSKWLKI